MDKKLFTAHDFLFQYSNSHQFFQVTRCRLADGDFPFGHVLNAAVWQFEYPILQLSPVLSGNQMPSGGRRFSVRSRSECGSMAIRISNSSARGCGLLERLRARMPWSLIAVRG